MTPKVSISIIICAHNEEKNLPRLLSTIKCTPNDQVVVVLDRCTDHTEHQLTEFSSRLPIKKVVINKTEFPNSPKKYAVQTGILAADKEYLVFTDADCEWEIDHLEFYRYLFQKNEVIIGYSIPNISQKKRSFTHQLQWIDACITASKYTFLTNIGYPYMTVGRNWGFKKSLFEPQFLKKHADIMSGDDDLLFQQLCQKTDKITLQTTSNVNTDVKSTFKDWVKQKLRHQQAGSKYSRSSLLLLSMFDLTLIFSLVLIFVGIWKSTSTLIFTGIGLELAIGGLLLSLSRDITKKLQVPFSLTTITFLGFVMLHNIIMIKISVFSQLIKLKKWK